MIVFSFFRCRLAENMDDKISFPIKVLFLGMIFLIISVRIKFRVSCSPIQAEYTAIYFTAVKAQ